MILRDAMLCLALSGVLVPAAASVIYQCQEKGVITYTDRPCSQDARRIDPAALPGLVVTPPPPRSVLERAAAFDARRSRELAERDRHDADWLEQHGKRRAREDLVREAKVRGRVVKGMTPDEVRQALGEPDTIDSGDSFGTEKQTWTYLDAHGARRTVSFKDGAVTTTARKDARRGK